MKQSYILPHECKQWPHARQHLLSILELAQLTSITKQMRGIDPNQQFHWNQKMLLSSGLQESKIVEILKYAAKNCLRVQNLFPIQIPISQPIEGAQGMSYIVLTKRQALCLVANMFFGTTQKQPQAKKLPIYIKFNRLSRRQNQIIKTILNYFQRSQEQDNMSMDQQNIVFFRIAQTPIFESWSQCEQKLCQVRFHESGAIEDLQHSIQMDFANKSIGGFFLSQTYTQQDIIFINNPELMPALLFHQYMRYNQCILMVGAQRYSKYTGYLQTYRYNGNFEDKRGIIELNLPDKTKVVVKDSWISAIDAIPYFISSQFSPSNLNRELNKAYVGFNLMKLDQGKKIISTGNWGSGAFNGNLQYKFLIQWLAASRAQRSIDYFSFANHQAVGIPNIIKKIKHLTVKQLLKLLTENAQHFSITRKVFKTLIKNTWKPETIE